jgi:type VI secretion system FHA domain protein
MAPPPAPARAAPQPAATPTPRPVASVAPRSAASPAPPQAAQLPDDFDPFAELEPATGDTPGAADDATLEDLVGMPPAVSGNIDNLFGLTGQETGKGDPLDAFLSPRDEAGAVKRRESLPFLTSAGDDPGEIGPGLEDHTPELQGAYKPPPVRSKLPTDAARPVRAQPQPAPQRIEPPISATSDASTDTLWEAFCEGAHLHSSTRQNLTPDLMRLLGATLRNAVDGAVALNAVRTTAKQELLVPVTVIRTRNNNPLKFAPDPTAALAAVVQPPMRGFMAGPEAMQDLMADLLGHAVGTMAGIRAAIEGMLARFEPAQLEKQLSSGGLLHTLVPMNRRARLWELYLEHYERIGEAAREDFQGLFGKAFVKAYEEQANRVAAARRNPD